MTQQLPTILYVLVLGLTPQIELLAVRLGITTDAIEIEREAFLGGNNLLYWGHRAPGKTSLDASYLAIGLCAYEYCCWMVRSWWWKFSNAWDLRIPPEPEDWPPWPRGVWLSADCALSARDENKPCMVGEIGNGEGRRSSDTLGFVARLCGNCNTSFPALQPQQRPQLLRTTAPLCVGQSRTIFSETACDTERAYIIERDVINEKLQSAEKAPSNYTSLASVPECKDGSSQYHTRNIQTIIFFACFPFFSESLCDRNSTSVASAPASLWDSG